MNYATNRRSFLAGAAAAGGLATFGDLSFLGRLRPVSAAEAKPDPRGVQLHSDIEPLVRLLEETPRDQLIGKVADRIRGGLNYRDILAALMLAGVRNVEPRPSVGFKFHTVLVVNSAHLASISSPDEHRWLPIFWALDYFKRAQAQDEEERGWTMPPPDESALPSVANARQEFIDAMDQWDEAKADAAITVLARTAGGNELFELFSRYGARDLRSIGHKAIFVANGWRTIETIGWRHAEPVLRSLAYALLAHEGSNPLQGDSPMDVPGRENAERLKKIRKDWKDGKLDDDATSSLLTSFRSASAADAAEQVVEALNAGVSPQSVWDALFITSAEWIMRQPAIVALHAMTTTNALRHAYDMTASDETRRYLMLQNAAFLTMFRDTMNQRGKVQDLAIDQLEPAPLEAGGDSASSEAALEEIFSVTGRDNLTAARKTLTYVRNHPDPHEFVNAARVLIFMKGDNSHDYKYSSAVLEDYLRVSPSWRGRYLAASVNKLRGSGDRDNPLVERVRSALA